MAFDFGSDILVDAMRAADPGKVAQVEQHLKSLSSAVSNAEANWPKFKAGLQTGAISTQRADSPDRFPKTKRAEPRKNKGSTRFRVYSLLITGVYRPDGTFTKAVTSRERPAAGTGSRYLPG